MATTQFNPLDYGAKPISGGGFNPLEHSAKPVEQSPNVFGDGVLGQIEAFGRDSSIGAAKGFLGTLRGTSQLLGSTINFAMGKGFTPSAPGGLQYNPLGEKFANANLEPDNTTQAVAKGFEQTAEFLTPFPALKMASLVTKMPKAGPVIAKSISQALEFGTKSAMQTGELGEETQTSAMLGAAFPPLGYAVKKAAPIIGDWSASIVGAMIGKSPQDVKIAFQNPIEVARKISAGMIPLDIREKAVASLKTFETAVKDTFAKGLAKLQELTPVRFSPGKYNSVKQYMSNTLQNAMTGMPQVFRDFKVSVLDKGRKLNFDKMNSSIVNAGERKNVKMAWETILNQRDFSPGGTQATAARLYALREFGENGASSALVSSIYNKYLKCIEQVYPELARLRTEYAMQSDIIKGIDQILRAVKREVADPVAVTGATKRLSNLYQEDAEAYLRAIQTLEKKTGINILKDLAATEFSKAVPASFGSKLSQAGIVAGSIAPMFTGAPWNPWVLLALPLFSPRFMGKAVTTAGRTVPVINEASKYAAPIITSGVQQSQRDLQFNQ